MAFLYWFLYIVFVLELVSVFKSVSFWIFLCFGPSERLWTLNRCNFSWSLHLHNSLCLIWLVHVLVGLIKNLSSVHRDLVESILLQLVDNFISSLPIVNGRCHCFCRCLSATEWMSQSIFIWIKFVSWLFHLDYWICCFVLLSFFHCFKCFLSLFLFLNFQLFICRELIFRECFVELFLSYFIKSFLNELVALVKIKSLLNYSRSLSNFCTRLLSCLLLCKVWLALCLIWFFQIEKATFNCLNLWSWLRNNKLVRNIFEKITKVTSKWMHFLLFILFHDLKSLLNCSLLFGLLRSTLLNFLKWHIFWWIVSVLNSRCWLLSFLWRSDTWEDWSSCNKIESTHKTIWRLFWWSLMSHLFVNKIKLGLSILEIIHSTFKHLVQWVSDSRSIKSTHQCLISSFNYSCSWSRGWGLNNYCLVARVVLNPRLIACRNSNWWRSDWDYWKLFVRFVVNLNCRVLKL